MNVIRMGIVEDFDSCLYALARRNRIAIDKPGIASRMKRKRGGADAGESKIAIRRERPHDSL